MTPRAEPTQASETPDPAALDILMKEYDTLRDLFTHTETSAQGMFNFYLTLISTVIGALVVFSQFAGGGLSLAVASLLLFFAAGVGSVYLSALAGRYAHMARYAQGLDALRRHLIEHFDAPVPALYREFLDQPAGRASGRPGLMWLFPTGTFQFAIAAMNSLSLAAATWFLLAAGGAGRGFSIAGLVFVLTFTVYNVYSHWIITTLIARLGIQIDTGGRLPLIAGRQ